MQQVFGGLLQSDVTCSACGSMSTVVDPFLDISLELDPIPRLPPLPLAKAHHSSHAKCVPVPPWPSDCESSATPLHWPVCKEPDESAAPQACADGNGPKPAAVLLSQPQQYASCRRNGKRISGAAAASRAAKQSSQAASRQSSPLEQVRLGLSSHHA